MVIRQGEIQLSQRGVILDSASEEDTKKLAQTLMLKHWNQIRKKGLIIGLVGDLGVGKTIFAKGIGRFLKIKEEIVSPSFTLVNEYKYIRHDVKGTFYHLDPWRLESFDDLKKLDLENMIAKNNIIAIEWANKFMDDIEVLSNKFQVQFIKLLFEDLGENKRRLSLYE